jgi:hypothetical protein
MGVEVVVARARRLSSRVLVRRRHYMDSVVVRRGQGRRLVRRGRVRLVVIIIRSVCRRCSMYSERFMRTGWFFSRGRV